MAEWRMILTGTGSSASVPKLSCITNPSGYIRGAAAARFKSPRSLACACTQVPFDPRNHRSVEGPAGGGGGVCRGGRQRMGRAAAYWCRLNPAAVLSRREPRDRPGEWYNLLVDCGKTFRESVLRNYPKNQASGPP
jgi:hypothetical protein